MAFLHPNEKQSNPTNLNAQASGALIGASISGLVGSKGYQNVGFGPPSVRVSPIDAVKDTMTQTQQTAIAVEAMVERICGAPPYGEIGVSVSEQGIEIEGGLLGELQSLSEATNKYLNRISTAIRRLENSL